MPSSKCNIAAFAAVVFSAAAACAGVGDSHNRPIRIIQTTESQFPASLTMRGISRGEVRAVLNIDADGKFADCLIAGYTHSELAVEILQAVRDWEYEPAYLRGEPTGTRVELAFAFEAHGAVLSLTALDTIGSNFDRMLGTDKEISVVCKTNELDAPLSAQRIVRPLHPGRALHPERPEGRVLLDFYIDSDGRPRMPVVLRTTHDAFAMAAVEALTQWRFAPLRHEGHPAIVRVQQEFVFSTRS